MPSAGVLAPKIGHIPSLNGLRAAAIALVVYTHAGFPGPFSGGSGVALFFFLSGYLITTLLRAEWDRFDRISLGGFYLRRALRIFPPMYIVIAIVILLSIVGVLPNTLSPGGTISTSLFFTNYWIIIDGHENVPAGLGVFWSLAVEEHFYLVFPLAYIAMRKWLPNRRHQVAVLAAVCIVILGWRIFLDLNGASDVRLYYATDTRVDALLWGAILAIGFNPVYGEVKLPKQRWVGSAVVIVSAVIFWAATRIPGEFVYGFTIQSLAAFGIFIPVLLAPQSWIGRVLNWRPIAWIGLISYSLYLTHRWALIGGEEWLGWPLGAVVGIGFAILLSWAMRVVVERPFERLRKRLSKVGENPNEGPPMEALAHSEVAAATGTSATVRPTIGRKSADT
ncbi:acyltransferase family protein [Microbacterium sp. P05]|uniref:acyltransferase family protein n=1 Tax=Microbacterium sp. P05 TaxID=3366948 RepID=UPI003746B3EA